MPPIAKNTILNVEILIASFGTSNVVAHITIAYNEPIISPNKLYTV